MTNAQLIEVLMAYDLDDTVDVRPSKWDDHPVIVILNMHGLEATEIRLS